MKKLLKLSVLALVIISLVTSVCCAFTACNEQKKCYYLNEAYELGLIGYDEVKNILYHYGALDNDFGEGFEPKPLNPAQLDDDTKQSIEHDYESMIRSQKGFENEQGWVEKYLGTYEKGIAIVTYSSMNVADCEVIHQIADLSYKTMGAESIVFWAF